MKEIVSELIIGLLKNPLMLGLFVIGIIGIIITLIKKEN